MKDWEKGLWNQMARGPDRQCFWIDYGIDVLPVIAKLLAYSKTAERWMREDENHPDANTMTIENWMGVHIRVPISLAEDEWRPVPRYIKTLIVAKENIRSDDYVAQETEFNGAKTVTPEAALASAESLMGEQGFKRVVIVEPFKGQEVLTDVAESAWVFGRDPGAKPDRGVLTKWYRVIYPKIKEVHEHFCYYFPVYNPMNQVIGWDINEASHYRWFAEKNAYRVRWSVIEKKQTTPTRLRVSLSEMLDLVGKADPFLLYGDVDALAVFSEKFNVRDIPLDAGRIGYSPAESNGFKYAFVSDATADRFTRSLQDVFGNDAPRVISYRTLL